MRIAWLGEKPALLAPTKVSASQGQGACKVIQPHAPGYVITQPAHAWTNKIGPPIQQQYALSHHICTPATTLVAPTLSTGSVAGVVVARPDSDRRRGCYPNAPRAYEALAWMRKPAASVSVSPASPHQSSAFLQLVARAASTHRTLTFDPWATPYGECLASDREELVPEARLVFDLPVLPL